MVGAVSAIQGVLLKVAFPGNHTAHAASIVWFVIAAIILLAAAVMRARESGSAIRDDGQRQATRAIGADRQQPQLTVQARRVQVRAYVDRMPRTGGAPEDDAARRAVWGALWIERQAGWKDRLLDQTRTRVDLDAEVAIVLECAATAAALRQRLRGDPTAAASLDSAGRALQRRVEAFETYLGEAARVCRLATDMRAAVGRSADMGELERSMIESGVDDVAQAQAQSPADAGTLVARRAALIEQLEVLRSAQSRLRGLDNL